MKKLILLATSSLLFIFGCAIPSMSYSVKNNFDDEFAEIKQIAQSSNYCMDNNKTGTPTYEFNIIMYPEEDSATYLFLDYDGSSWLFIEYVKFVADGEKIKIPYNKMATDVLYGGKITEWGQTRVSLETLSKLVNAEELQARLYGKDYYHEIRVDCLKPIQRN